MKPKNKLYKHKYAIAFYDSTDEEFIDMFDTTYEICKAKGLPTTKTNINLVNVEIYRALKRPDHSTRMLNGKLMHVYMIDITDNK